MKFLGQISQLCPWHCLNLTVCTQLLWLFNHESHRYLSLYRSNTRGADGPYVWSAPHHRMRGSRCLATERWRTFCSISHLCPIFIGISYHFKPQRQVMTYRDPQKWSIFHMESWLSCSDIMNACGSRIAMAASQTLWEMGKRTSHISWLTIKIPDELNASVNSILFPFLGMMASKDCPHMSFNSCFGLLILLLMRRVIHEHCH